LPCAPPVAPVDLADAAARLEQAWTYDGLPKLLVLDDRTNTWYPDPTSTAGIIREGRLASPRLNTAILILEEMSSPERLFFDAWYRGWVQTCSGRLTARDPQ
jgi:hypothetical protein